MQICSVCAVFFVEKVIIADKNKSKPILTVFPWERPHEGMATMKVTCSHPATKNGRHAQAGLAALEGLQSRATTSNPLMPLCELGPALPPVQVSRSFENLQICPSNRNTYFHCRIKTSVVTHQ